MGSDVVANAVRLVTVGLLLLAQALWMYWLSVSRVTADHHREDCPYSRPWLFSGTSVPPTEHCPYCVWSRIHSFNRSTALLGFVLVVVALLSLIAMLETTR